MADASGIALDTALFSLFFSACHAAQNHGLPSGCGQLVSELGPPRQSAEWVNSHPLPSSPSEGGDMPGAQGPRHCRRPLTGQDGIPAML